LIRLLWQAKQRQFPLLFSYLMVEEGGVPVFSYLMVEEGGVPVYVRAFLAHVIEIACG